ncbi:MAG: hypothetical protein WBP56_00060 [Polyangia bacterium]
MTSLFLPQIADWIDTLPNGFGHGLIVVSPGSAAGVAGVAGVAAH